MPTQFDILWVLFAAVLVLIMQGGFLCLESGLTRTKNAINVAMKNIVDFIVTMLAFWAVGFGLMFGGEQAGLVGTTHFFTTLGSSDEWRNAFFLFQAMFCATAVTIVSGAIAERTRFRAYVMLALITTVVIYPVFGHWSWGSLFGGTAGWLESLGFVDFAGSTVVHSAGAWVALAAVLHVGPRKGRFENGRVNEIPASNMALAMLGVLLFFVGWVGFNGGSTLALNSQIPGIVVNTLLAGAAGAATAMLLGARLSPTMAEAVRPLNGALSGMVAITANCHAVTGGESLVIGAVGAIAMLLCDRCLIRLRIDDAIGAVPVHLAAGIWGTLAVAIFGDPEILGTGLTRGEQLLTQLIGIVTCAAWAFGVSFCILNIMRPRWPLRVSAEAEHTGLNVAEHGARSAIFELIETMEQQRESKSLALRAPVEPFTEVGQIAETYNRLLAALQGMTEHTSRIVQDIRDGIITFSRQGVLMSMNPGAEQLMNLKAASCIGQPLEFALRESNCEAFGIDWQQAFAGSARNGQLLETREIVRFRDDSDPKFFEFTASESSDANGEFYTAVIRDITERRKVEQQLLQQKELAQVTLESLGEGVMTTDRDGNIKYINPIAASLLEVEFEEVEGEPLDGVLRLTKEIDDTPCRIGEMLRGGLLSRVQRLGNVNLDCSAAGTVTLNLTAAPILDYERRQLGAVVVFQDVSKARELERRLAYQATHDPLTGLLNRHEFDRRLRDLILDSKSDGTRHTLCYMDLDQFKLVNDTCGHHAGDELLRQICGLLRDELRSSDIFARLGGDEFGVILRNCDLDRGLDIANSLRRTIERYRFTWQGSVFSIASSIGIVGVSDETESSIEAMSTADTACYIAKQSGRNRVHVYEINDTVILQQRGQMHWATRIRQAIDEGRMRLFHQSIVPVDPDSGRETHHEIFVRMLDEQGDIVPPGAFIPAAERFGIMPSLDRWIVKNTLSCLSTTRNPLNCAINLSGASITDDEFLEFVKRQLAMPNIRPEKVCFEITETAAIAEMSSARRFIAELKTLGCRFALDDFGSGLASFGYLKSLPVDYLKIDGLFVRDMVEDKIDRAMVESINDIGHAMGIETICEFVESAETLAELRKIGVDYAQGFYISKPEPLDQFENVSFWPR